MRVVMRNKICTFAWPKHTFGLSEWHEYRVATILERANYNKTSCLNRTTK